MCKSASSVVAVISLPQRRCIETTFKKLHKNAQSWMLANSLPPFLATSLKCKALCIVMSFLVLWFICWSSSLIHFKNGPKYLSMGTIQLFIPLMRFLPCGLVSDSFFRSPEVFFFWIFSFIYAYIMVSASNITKYCWFPFLRMFSIW